MAFARITGWGCYLPERVLSNADLERMVDTSDEWIRARSGILRRRIADSSETSGTMGVRAGRAALEVADCDPAALDLVIVATATPDYPGFPATASLVQHALGARRAGAFDLLAGCSGFLYGLVTAAQYIQGGGARRILLIGAETLSRIVDWSDRATCVLFGDGAGAVVVEATDRPGGLLGFELGSDGGGEAALYLDEDADSVDPDGRRRDGDGRGVLRMHGREVFRFATTVVPESLRGALQRAGLAPRDLDLFIPHQANARIIAAMNDRLGLDSDRVVVNLHEYGNTSAASIPIALCEAIAAGRVHPGDRIAMAGFGAGLSWGSVVWQW
jgi:3-oxoacyl-[acyl-carrier-protein] synthase-3